MGNSILIQEGLKYYGLKEVPGSGNNPIIVEMLRSVRTWAQADSVAWCSAYLNYICNSTGYELSGALDARSWLRVGVSVAWESADIGDVVVLWRGSRKSWKGHVGLLVNKFDSGQRFRLLGGNQSDAVNISNYDKSRVLDVRRLRLVGGGS